MADNPGLLDSPKLFKHFLELLFLCGGGEAPDENLRISSRHMHSYKYYIYLFEI